MHSHQTWLPEVDDRRDAAWRLFAILPVNKGSASLLAHLGKTLAPHGDDRVQSAPSDMDVLATIKRWKVENEDKFGWFRECRAALGRLLKDEELKDSDDIALRQAYYGGYWWNHRNTEEVREAYAKDKDKFLEVAIENLSFYRNERVRAELRQCCHDYAYKGGDPGRCEEREYYIDRFDAESNLLERKQPEWFANYYGHIPFYRVGNLSLRAEKRLVFLQEQIKAISRELVGTKSEDDDSSWYDDDKASLIAKMKAAIDQSNQLVLSKLASVTGWACL